MNRLAVSMLLAVSLSGCIEPEPRVVTKIVSVPTPVECVPKTFPTPPNYPDTDEALRAAADAAERFQLVVAGRLLRNARLGEVEPAIEACREVK